MIYMRRTVQSPQVCHSSVVCHSSQGWAMQLVWTEPVYSLGQKFIHLYTPQHLTQYFWKTEVIPLPETGGGVEDKHRRNLFLHLSTSPLTEKNSPHCRKVPGSSVGPRHTPCPHIPLGKGTAIPPCGTALPLYPVTSYYCPKPHLYTFSIRSSWSSPLRVFPDSTLVIFTRSRQS